MAAPRLRPSAPGAPRRLLSGFPAALAETSRLPVAASSRRQRRGSRRDGVARGRYTGGLQLPRGRPASPSERHCGRHVAGQPRRPWTPRGPRQQAPGRGRVAPAARLCRRSAVPSRSRPPSCPQHAWPDPQRHERGLLGALSQQGSGGPGGGLHGPAEEERQLRNEERRPHDLGGHRGHVALLHRGFPGAQGGPCSSIGDESSVHRFCIYVAHLGQVHSFIDSATSICLSSEEERKKSQHVLDQKYSDFLFMRKKFSASLLFYRELNEN